MQLFTERVNSKCFDNIISPQLSDVSQEYRALATLKLFFPEKFYQWYKSDGPDLQECGGNVGAEVTCAVDEDDMKASKEFIRYRNNDGEKRNKAETRILKTSSKLETYENGLIALVRSGELDEEEIYKAAIRKKLVKSCSYKAKVKILYLAVILPEIPSTYAEEMLAVWTRETLSNSEYQEIYVISERFCIRIDLVTGDDIVINIDKNQNEALRKIARMTAEGEIDLDSEEWN